MKETFESWTIADCARAWKMLGRPHGRPRPVGARPLEMPRAPSPVPAPHTVGAILSRALCDVAARREEARMRREEEARRAREEEENAKARKRAKSHAARLFAWKTRIENFSPAACAAREEARREEARREEARPFVLRARRAARLSDARKREEEAREEEARAARAAREDSDMYDILARASEASYPYEARAAREEAEIRAWAKREARALAEYMRGTIWGAPAREEEAREEEAPEVKARREEARRADKCQPLFFTLDGAPCEVGEAPRGRAARGACKREIAIRAWNRAGMRKGAPVTSLDIQSYEYCKKGMHVQAWAASMQRTRKGAAQAREDMLGAPMEIIRAGEIDRQRARHDVARARFNADVQRIRGARALREYLNSPDGMAILRECAENDNTEKGALARSILADIEK